MAMPAIGSGNLGIPIDLVVNTMFSEVDKFSMAHPNTSLQDIKFVAYDQNTSSVAVGFVDT